MADATRVLIADDSPTIRRYLTDLIEETPDLRVIGEATDGEEAIAQVQSLRPDVVSMDINMPRLNGLDATRRIMSRYPTPIVVVSNQLEVDVHLSMNALQAGALAVINKPPNRANPAFETRRQQLVNTLRAMADVRVISRRERLRQETPSESLPAPPRERLPHPEILVMGASTGGPSAINRLLRVLPADFPLPILIVQHMPPEFMSGLARWLDGATPLHVALAQHGMRLEAGRVLIAPGTAHLTVRRYGLDLLAYLVAERGEHRYQPSVDALFTSVAQTCGSAALGVLLTGMGEDGAQGLARMRQAGAITLAQDEASATVYGMPQAAVRLGAAQAVVPLADLPAQILKHL